jgi:ketosteroid isomerase-like protein
MTNKYFNILLFLFCSIISSKAQKTLEGLILAEKNFAAYSVANNTKDAFLKFLDSNGVVFENGKPVNGIETWLKKEKRSGILNWLPQYAEVSASGDFGYTTGPWIFQQNSVQDSVVASGHYTTVWHVNKEGDWKFLVDLGTNNNPFINTDSVYKIRPTQSLIKPGNKKSLLAAETGFFQSMKKLKQKTYQKNISTISCILKRNNTEPACSQDSYLKTISATPDFLEYKILGSGISVAGDIGYIFGSVVSNNKTENYLRIWRKEKQGWKLAVEVLRY